MDVNSSLTPEATASTVTETPSFTEQTITPEASQASAQQGAQQPTAQEIADYMKDERTKRMWTNPATKAFDPNLMYKSIRSGDDIIEKQYKPLRKQADEFTKFLKEYGYEADPAKLKAEFDELKTWRDPENPTVKRANYLSYFLDDPEYGPETTTFLENQRKKAIRREFGEGVSDDLVKEIISNREYREQQESEKKRLAKEQEHQKLVGTIDQGWNKVQEEAKKIGFPVSDDIKNQLFDICAKENVDPRFMLYKFQEMYRDEIAKHQRASIQAELTKAAQKTRKSGIIPASSHQVRSVATQSKNNQSSMMDRVKSTLGLKT